MSAMSAVWAGMWEGEGGGVAQTPKHLRNQLTARVAPAWLVQVSQLVLDTCWLDLLARHLALCSASALASDAAVATCGSVPA